MVVSIKIQAQLQRPGKQPSGGGPAAIYLGLFRQFVTTWEGGGDSGKLKEQSGTIASVGLGIFHVTLPLEICLPHDVLLSLILKISWFPQSRSEVKLRREFLEEHAH